MMRLLCREALAPLNLLTAAANQDQPRHRKLTPLTPPARHFAAMTLVERSSPFILLSTAARPRFSAYFSRSREARNAWMTH